MNMFQFTIVVIIFWLQLTECFTANHQTRTKKPKKAVAQRRSGSSYVDFGAHTGPLGSYGWYADFPANKN